MTTTDDALRAMVEHRECGKPKYDGCYAHWPMPHCRADGMAWPCDVDRIRAALAPALAPSHDTNAAETWQTKRWQEQQTSANPMSHQINMERQFPEMVRPDDWVDPKYPATEASTPAPTLNDDLLDLVAQVRGGIDGEPYLNRRGNKAAHDALFFILARLPAASPSETREGEAERLLRRVLASEGPGPAIYDAREYLADLDREAGRE